MVLHAALFDGVCEGELVLNGFIPAHCALSALLIDDNGWANSIRLQYHCDDVWHAVDGITYYSD